MPAPDKNFFILTTSALRALDEASHRLSEMLKKIPRPSPGERTQIQIQRAQIEADWQKIYQQMLAASQGTLTITPPGPEDIARAKEIADTLDKMTVASNNASEVVTAATEVMGIWAKTKPTLKT